MPITKFSNNMNSAEDQKKSFQFQNSNIFKMVLKILNFLIKTDMEIRT